MIISAKAKSVGSAPQLFAAVTVINKELYRDLSCGVTRFAAVTVINKELYRDLSCAVTHPLKRLERNFVVACAA